MDATKKALPVHLRKSFNPEAASFSPVERTGPAVQVTTTATSSLQSILGFAPEDVNQKQSSNLTCLDQKQAPINESMISEVHQLKDDQERMSCLGNHQVKENALQNIVAQTFVHSNNSDYANLRTSVPDEGSANRALDVHKSRITLDSHSLRTKEILTESSEESRQSTLFHGLYGKLIEEALTKTLSAKDLAFYLPPQSAHVAFDDATLASALPRTSSEAIHADQRLLDHFEKVQLASGPREETTHTEINSGLASDHLNHPRSAVAAPVSFFQPSGAVRTYSSGRVHQASSRKPRAYARSKRADQGPEPSAADVYPEDAHWDLFPPHRRPCRSSTTRSSFTHYSSSPRHELRINDAANWPTPVELYTPQPPPSSFNTLESHVRSTGKMPALMNIAMQMPSMSSDKPSMDDVCESHEEALSLIDELPFLADKILGSSWAIDSIECDPHPLSPSQLDGSKYGLRYYGLAIGNDGWHGPSLN